MIFKKILKLAILCITIFLVYDCLTTSTWDSILQKLFLIGIVAIIELSFALFDLYRFTQNYSKLLKQYNDLEISIKESHEGIFTKSDKSLLLSRIDICNNYISYSNMEKRAIVKRLESNTNKLKSGSSYKNLSIN